jgi:hypothetical protein
VTGFGAAIAAAYATEGDALDIGRGVHEGKLLPDAAVRVPLATMNRHGLVAGATGTGKTKTLQLLAEQLSRAGVPVLVADVKGDVSGLAAAAEPGGAGEQRMADLGLPFEPASFPVEFLALGGLGPGVPLRATVTDFGPQLLAKVLGANATQESSLALVFHYADEKGCRCSTSPTCARCSRSSTPTPAGRSWRASAGSRARPWACCCARSSGSRPAAARSSSASRSSTSPTTCGWRTTGVA